MIVIAYFTRETPYAEEARLLRSSLEKVGMNYRIVGIADQGSWDLNTAFKPRFIQAQRKFLSGPLLYVDVDAFFHRDCSAFFDHLGEKGIDVAAHWFAGPAKGHNFKRDNCACLSGSPCDRLHRLLSGTLFLGDTPRVRDLLKVWVGLNDLCSGVNWGSGGGQRNLWALLTSQRRHLNLAKIPGRYCYVFDKPQGYPKKEPRIIEHTIASRENRGRKRARPLRRKRMKELKKLVQ